jgi:hypothetical protein
VGELGLSALAAATFALEGSSEARLAQTDAALDDLAGRRNDLASRLRARLEAAAFAGVPLDPTEVAGLQAEAESLLAEARGLTAAK